MSFFPVRATFVLLASLSCLSLNAQDYKEPPPHVLVSQVSALDTAPSKKYIGTVESKERVDIIPRVTGTLEKIYFKEGEIVQEGMLLYEIESTTYAAKVDALRAQREQLVARCAFAASQLKRHKKLLDKDAVSQSVYDEILSNHLAMTAQLKEVNASLRDAENTLSYTRIYASITGRIGKSVYTKGALITALSGKLTDIEMVSPIYVRFSLPERVFRGVYGGQSGIKSKAIVTLNLADGTCYEDSGKIALIANKINVKTNTMMLWAEFTNADQALISGSFASVNLSPKLDAKLLSVPPSAVVVEGDFTYVYTVDKTNVVHKKRVILGDMARRTQIVTSGIALGETVVVDGTHKIRDGLQVVPNTCEQVN